MPTNFYLSSKPDKHGERSITVSIHIKGVRCLTSIGYSISPSSWNPETGLVKRGSTNRKGIEAALINSKIKALSASFDSYEAHDATLSKEEISSEVNRILDRGSHDKKPCTPFFQHYDEFIAEGRNKFHWKANTFKKWTPLRHHLEKFNPYVTFDFFTEDGLTEYLNFCSVELQMLDVSVKKELSLLRWYLNWALSKGYHTNTSHKVFKQKFRDTKKPVIFLTDSELIKLFNYKIPKNGTEVTVHDMNSYEYLVTVENKASMDKARDLFCFCAFTSLRYSDMQGLKRTDIYDGAIHIVTNKTDDPLVIELSERAKAILEKYKGFDFDGHPLPPLSNQKLNQYIKQICELCEFMTPITITTYLDGVRDDYTFPKWQMITAHAARRTFICHALASGIPVQTIMKWTGHSDYDAMKPYIDVADSTKVRDMKRFDLAFE